MIGLLLVAQLATAPIMAGDSVYTSPALRDMVTAAAAENRRLAQVIPAYRATVESELAWIRQDSIDREHAIFVQQHASRIQWQNGQFDVQVISARPAIKLPEFVGWPSSPIWLLPALYGERIPFVFEMWFTKPARNPTTGARVRDTVAIEHPFGSARERRYRYSGGDTVATIRVNGRMVTIVRVHVDPHFSPDELAAALDGDVFLDATRHQIVRMRGRIIRFLPERSAAARLQRATGSTLAPYIEVTNEEVGGQFWLPRSERIELQLASVMLQGSREIWRLMATFSNHVVDSTASGTDRTSTDPQIHVTVPTEDVLGRTHDWSSPLGVATHDVHSVDFGDLAPPNWRDDGPPRFSMLPTMASRLFHIDPVEGVYTGLEGTMTFRDVAPGASVRGFGGWAWAERTVRGGGAVAWRRDSRVTSLFAQRALETTNDFLVVHPGIDPVVTDLLGFTQRRDYVDRVTTALSWSDIRRSAGDGIFSAQIGAGHDGSEQTRYTHSLFPSVDSVLPNRAATNGSYGRVAFDYEWHPDVTAENDLTGVRAQVHYEAATGQLSWQRATIAIAQRAEVGPVVIMDRLDGGLVASPHAIPPQQMFELGGYDHLRGYSYKQFAGDRAAVASTGAGYLFPIFQTSRVPGAFGNFLPPVNPGINAGLEFGWTTLSSDAARAAILAMSPTPSAPPLSVATEGVRGSGGFGLTLFSGLFHVGYARALDSGAKWRRVVGFGVSY